uniref:GATOR complex protein NPRL3 n=1 Tax=Panagrolaimus superbus TaxID=310955 RepID=A0A914ZDN1_9BILA
MALLDTGKPFDQPWGFVVSLKDKKEDQVLFVYPTKEQPLEKMSSIEDVIESMQITRKAATYKSWKELSRFGISLHSLGSVISPKHSSVGEINIKVDALRFLGSWFNVSEDSEEAICIAFVLSGNCPQDIVDSFLIVSRQISGAICSLEKASNFVRNQLALIQRIHEGIDMEQSEGLLRGNITPFEECLRESSMLQSLQRIFEDVFVHGNNVMYLDKHVQLNICIRSQALLYCTLLPRTNTALRKMIESIRPYHTLIFVDDERPTPDKHPLLLSFLEHYSPERSLEEIRVDMRCTMDQLMLFVHNLIQWGRAVISYPICLQNSYTIGEPSSVDIEDLAKYYNYLFPDPTKVSKNGEIEKSLSTSILAEILELLSPVVTLEEYFVNASRFHPRAANMETVVFLLKTGLMIQLHVHIQLIEPSQAWLQGKSISKDLSPRVKTLIKNCHHLEEVFKEYILYACSDILSLPLSEPNLFEALGTLISLIPLFLKCEYVEKIIYETKVTRSSINRVIDLFHPILFVFEIPATI